MPKYFFSFADGAAAEAEASSVDEAKCEAARLIGGMVCEDAAHFWKSGELVLTVSDEAGLVLFTLELVGNDAPVLKMDQAAQHGEG